jgi:polyhydroxybutyrate depolymerase
MRRMIRGIASLLSLVLILACSSRDAAGRPQRNLRFGTPLKQQTEIRDGAQGLGPGEYVRHLNHGGRKRFYEVHVPPGYKPGTPTPVVLVYHGGGGQPTHIRWQTKMDGTSDRHGFIAVYPAGTGLLERRLLTFNAGGGAVGYAARENVDDVEFTRALLDDLARFFTVDADRVYATGLSNGGMLAYRLACELSDRIAAVAPVGASVSVPDCRPARPVSVMHIHGAEDRAVPMQGGVGPVGKTGFRHRSVADSVGRFIQANGLSPQPTKTWQAGAATFTQYGPGANGAEVLLVTVGDGGHTWPGGDVSSEAEAKLVGRVSRAIAASEEIWKFFSRHTRTGPAK